MQGEINKPSENRKAADLQDSSQNTEHSQSNKSTHVQPDVKNVPEQQLRPGISPEGGDTTTERGNNNETIGIP